VINGRAAWIICRKCDDPLAVTARAGNASLLGVGRTQMAGDIGEETMDR